MAATVPWTALGSGTVVTAGPLAVGISETTMAGDSQVDRDLHGIEAGEGGMDPAYSESETGTGSRAHV